jgi:DNA-binding transcriptional ArsR family regulator
LKADKGAAAVTRQHLLDWFEPDELELCERCGEQAGLHIGEAGTFICFGCGYIRWAGGKTVVDALQGRIAASTAVERRILELLERRASLAYDQIAAHLDEPPSAVRSALASLRDGGLVEVLTTGDIEAHSRHVAMYWRLTDTGRDELARRRRA